MNKVFIAATLLPLYTVLFFSCEKKNLKPPPAVNQQQLIEEAKDFFNREIDGKNGYVHNSLPVRRNVLKIPEWRDAYIQETKNKMSVIVPLKFEKSLTLKSPAGDSSLSIEKQTTLVISKADNKWKAEVVTWIPGKFLAGNTGHYSDYVFIEDWAGNSIDRYLIKNGQLFKPLSILPQAGNRIDESSCIHINWFLCDISAGGSVLNCEFLFSETIGCDQGFAAINESGSDCVVVNELANATVTAQQLSSSSVPINNVRRYKTVKWRILKSHSWSLHSVETGIIKYITARARWEWESLTHNSISLEGWTGSARVSWSQGIGTPSFVAGAPNVLFAGMHLHFSVTYTPTVCDQPLHTFSWTRSYTNSSFWNANPS